MAERWIPEHRSDSLIEFRDPVSKRIIVGSITELIRIHLLLNNLEERIAIYERQKRVYDEWRGEYRVEARVLDWLLLEDFQYGNCERRDRKITLLKTIEGD